jgi:hypothetical protein
MAENPDQPYRNLAAAVIKQALDDVVAKRSDAEGGRALDFLFSPVFTKPRALWLGWLGLTEQQFWGTLGKPTFNGGTNRILPLIRDRLALAGLGVGV